MFDIEDYKKAQRQQVKIAGVRNDIVTIKSVKINGRRKMRAVYDIKPIEK
jgi:hypothetical protein